MKKIIFFILFSIITFPQLNAQLCGNWYRVPEDVYPDSATLAENRLENTVFKIPQGFPADTLTIDGNIDAFWQSVEKLPIERFYDSLRLTPDTGYGAYAQMMYDDSWLYLLVVVYGDDSVDTEGATNRMDRVELMFQNTFGGREDGTYDHCDSADWRNWYWKQDGDRKWAMPVNMDNRLTWLNVDVSNDCGSNLGDCAEEEMSDWTVLVANDTVQYGVNINNDTVIYEMAYHLHNFCKYDTNTPADSGHYFGFEISIRDQDGDDTLTTQLNYNDLGNNAWAYTVAASKMMFGPYIGLLTTFNITESATSNPIAHALVSIPGYRTQMTDMSGNVTFLLDSVAQYNYTVSHPDYLDSNGFVTVNSDTTINVSLDTTYQVKPTAHDTTVQLNAGCLSADMFVKASGSTGWYRWYNEATGGTLLDSTTTGQYIMNGISSDTSIYVSSWDFVNSSASLVDSVFSEKYISLCVEGYMDSRPTITIEAWFNTSGTIGSGDRYDILEDKNWGHNIWLTDQGKVAYYVRTLPDDALHFISSTETGLNDGTWHHFACVFDHDSMFIYIDGALSAEDGNWGANRYKNLNSSTWWLFGKNGDDYRGKIDEIRFWTTARTQQEIQDNMNKCVPADIDGLMWYFQFNEEFGARTKMGYMDVTGNSNEQCGNDTLYNSAHKVVSSNLNLSCTVSESSRDTLDISVTEASNTLYARSYSLCETGDVTLTARGGSGQYRWYDQAVGGTLIDSTSTLLVENITADTALYVSTWDWENPSQSTAQRILLDIDATNASMNLTNCVDYYDNSSELTMEVWVKTLALDRRIIMHNQNSDYNIELNAHGASSGCVGWSMKTDVAGTMLHGDIPVNDDEWHHVACVFDNGQASIYIDGVLDTTATLPGTMIDISTSARNIVGGTRATGNYRWDGYFDEFRLWTTARTQEEIQDYMYKCLYATEDNLIIYVNFNDNMDNLTGVCPLQNEYETYVDEGPFLRCGLCESSRDTVNIIMLDTTDITTDKLDSSSFCPGDTITVPFSVCPTSSICANPSVAGLLFDGSNDYITINNLNYNSSGYTEVTVEAWIKTSDGEDQMIASFDRNEYWRLEVNGNGGGTGEIGWDILTNSGQLDFGSNGTRIDDGDWHHVAGVYDNGDAYIYIDGNLVNSTSLGTTFGSGNTRWGFIGVGSESSSFGDQSLGPTSYYNGTISELRIWNVARTQTEIQNTMNSCTVTGNESGLVLYYKFTEESGDTTTDETGNGYTGDLTNFNTGTCRVDGTDQITCDTVYYNFIVELSDASGDFSSPTTLQDTLIGRSLVCDDYLSEITTVLPDPLSYATGYKIRVVGLADTGSTMIGNISPTIITIENCGGCPVITATLSAVSGFDTVCEGSNTQLQINFTSGNNPFDLIYSDLTTNDTITGITQDTAFYPSMYPAWTAGVSDTVIYSIISITDSVNCEGVNLDSVLIEVFKKPNTGNPYYIENEHNQ